MSSSSNLVDKQKDNHAMCAAAIVLIFICSQSAIRSLATLTEHVLTANSMIMLLATLYKMRIIILKKTVVAV
jgi:hypothetical protein